VRGRLYGYDLELVSFFRDGFWFAQGLDGREILCGRRAPASLRLLRAIAIGESWSHGPLGMFVHVG